MTSLPSALTTTSFDSTVKRRMVKFAESFPGAAIVAHKTPQGHQNYANQAATNAEGEDD